MKIKKNQQILGKERRMVRYPSFLRNIWVNKILKIMKRIIKKMLVGYNYIIINVVINYPTTPASSDAGIISDYKYFHQEYTADCARKQVLGATVV